jgi:hypothetical protein
MTKRLQQQTSKQDPKSSMTRLEEAPPSFGSLISPSGRFQDTHEGKIFSNLLPGNFLPGGIFPGFWGVCVSFSFASKEYLELAEGVDHVQAVVELLVSCR